MNIKKKKVLIILCGIMVCFSCQHTSKHLQVETDGQDSLQASPYTSYAKGFRVEQREGWRLLEICDPQTESNSSSFRFALVEDRVDAEGIPADMPKIRVPIKSAICTTTLQLSGFLKLQALDVVSGVMSAKRLFSKELKQRLDDGRIVKIGKEGNFDVELIMANQPSVILVSLSKRGGFDVLAELGIPLVPYMGYQETSPLAQAEWIKIVGLLLGKEHEADSLFSVVEKNYLAARSLVASADTLQLPSVLYGKLHGDNWYAMGGESFISQICHDAGARYFMSGDERSGGVNLDFENVYSQANDVDFWIVQSKGHSAITYKSLSAEDERYMDFRPWKENRIITCDMGNTPFNELSPMEPDTILLDFIHAFHPNILKDYQPKYYKVL